MIDILIPTYNRAGDLRKNLDLLASQINATPLESLVTVIVSNNCSSDGTAHVLEIQEQASNLPMKVFHQTENIGVEKNVVFLLANSNSKFIMFLGDDDYLPNGYLEFLVDRASEVNDLSAVIPGNSALHADGALVVTRSEKQSVQYRQASFVSSLLWSQYGHQLSGLLLRREGLLEHYCRHPEYRNLYPFIFFLSQNNVRGTTIYVPKYQVSITIFNTKDWTYDDSGCLTDIFRNYYLVFGKSSVKSFLSCCAFMFQQSWRLRLSQPLRAVSSFSHLIRSSDVLVAIKLFLPLIYVLLFARLGLRVASRILRKL